MARKIITQVIDDITGDMVPDGLAETIRFSINDVDYSIDLGPESARQFREALAPYTENAERQTGTKRSSIAPRRSTARVDPAQLRAIRDWARANGYEVSDRGRIPAQVIDAYEAAH
ncbi:MAG TPA: Lsr2 family protein [Candidatus Avipropionibacterium avicola]|uniref:Lsr2 family protein n=1 Tax=Candidatus Avipropionibacterium avicola TaxID=2840701 RepID=A0A9D1GUL9_9ACTN|nr:Lsr2 family protein [Candidatus Avipropionibacterium avicola]